MCAHHDGLLEVVAVLAVLITDQQHENSKRQQNKGYYRVSSVGRFANITHGLFYQFDERFASAGDVLHAGKFLGGRSIGIYRDHKGSVVIRGKYRAGEAVIFF